MQMDKVSECSRITNLWENEANVFITGQKDLFEDDDEQNR